MVRAGLLLVAVLSVVIGCAAADAPPAATSPPIAELAAPSAEASAPASPPSDGGPIPVSSADPSRGNPDALGTVVEFGDLEDAFVVRAAPALRDLETRYTPDQLRIVWKHYPGAQHRHAKEAAVAAQAAFVAGGSSAFWAFHDAAL